MTPSATPTDPHLQLEPHWKDAFAGLFELCKAHDGETVTILTETLSPAERQTITQGPFPAATNATLAFSAKEALFKALYPRVGHHFGFDAAELATPPAQHGLTLTLSTDLANGLTRGQRFDLHHDLTPTHVLTWLAAPAS